MRWLIAGLLLLCASSAEAFWQSRNSTYNASVSGGGGGGGGSVAFDAATTFSGPALAGTTFSFTHTPVGTPTAVAVLVHLYNAATQNITGVTYGGAACTQTIGSASDAGGSSSNIWGCGAPPSGAKTVVITISSAGAYIAGAAVSVTNGNAATALDGAGATNVGSGASISQACPGATNDLMVDIAGGATSVTDTAGGGQTIRWGPVDVASNRSYGSTAAGAASVTMSWTFSGSVTWSYACAAFLHS